MNYELNTEANKLIKAVENFNRKKIVLSRPKVQGRGIAVSS